MAVKTSERKQDDPKKAKASERQTDIKASSLVVGDGCTLTKGCRGRIRVYSVNNVDQMDAGGNRVGRLKQQYLTCDICGKLPINPKVTVVLRNTAAK